MTFKDLLIQIKIWEGYRPQKYNDAVGIPTVGYGFTASCFPDGIVPDYMSKDKADELLEERVGDIAKNVEKKLLNWNYSRSDIEVLLYPLTDFTYNCGTGNLHKLTGEGSRSVQTIKEKILLYNKAGGKTLLGLQRRRQWEADEIAKGLLNGTIPLINPTVKHTAKEVQLLLNGKYNAGLVVDGIIGQKTINAIYAALDR